MHGDLFKNGSRSCNTSKMELFATTGNARAYNQWTVVFACYCGNRPYLKAKLKSDENGNALKAASDMISCFVDMFLHSFKNSYNF